MVTDNASNMISTVNKLNASGENVDDEYEGLHENEEFYRMVESVAGTAHIHHMRCAVHTLQLAIRDGLKLSQIARILTKLRSVVVVARRRTVDAILKLRANKGAIVDQATRWESTYLMLQCLIELKDTLNDMADATVYLNSIE